MSADIFDKIEYASNSNYSATSIEPEHSMCLSANVNVIGNEPVRFHPFVSVFPLDLEALEEQFHL